MDRKQAIRNKKRPQLQKVVTSQTFEFIVLFVVWQDLNLRPSGYEPNKIGGFLTTSRGGGQMVDRLCEPNTLVETWWTIRKKNVRHQSMFNFTSYFYRTEHAHIHSSELSTRSITSKSRVSFTSLISGDRCTRLLARSVGHFAPRSTIAAQLGVVKISAGLF